MSQTRTVVVERNHDYLYDKIYQLSSERDHGRATYKANTNSDRIQVIPNFPTMFSDLKHFPRSQVKLIDKDPVPKFINRHWRGFSDQAKLMMRNLSKLGETSSIMNRYYPSNNMESVNVGGQDRFRYFRRPIIPYASQLPPDVILAPNRSENIYQINEEDVFRAATRSIGTQTIFRDSSIQTDPYSPEYLVRPGEAPEVLTLASLTCGRGLPAGLHEVEMIDRARHRRELEAQLPPLNDFSQSEKRRKMMDAIETEEWKIREQEIGELQKLRLEILIKLLRKREEAFQDMSNQKLDRLWNKKQQKKESHFYNLRLKYIKAIRHLLKNRKNVENKHIRRDIIKDYSECSSQTWAPLTRVGQFLDNKSQQCLVNSRYLNSYNGLLELEESLPDFVLNPKIVIPKQNQYTRSGFKKRKFREQENLKVLHESIKETASIQSEAQKPLKFLQKIEKPIPRPPTPTIECADQDENNEEREIILLQKIIRGRAIQAMMFEGKQKRNELIKELRTTHSLLSHEAEIDKEEKAIVINLQRQRMLLEHREEHINEALSGLEGEVMAEMFDFLSKELLRVQEERRIHAFSMLAERERRIREAEESGLRQVEERRRREQDEVFKQVVRVNQSTVDNYLKDIIDDNIDWSATNISKMEIEKLAEQINKEAYDSELTNSRLQQEEIVADLVYNFLIPEVHKMSVQEKIGKNQRKFLFSVHREIFKTSEDIIQNNPSHKIHAETETGEDSEKIPSDETEPLQTLSKVDNNDPISEQFTSINFVSDQIFEKKESPVEEFRARTERSDSEVLMSDRSNVSFPAEKGTAESVKDEFEDEKDKSLKSERYEGIEDEKDRSVKSEKYDEFEDEKDKSLKSEKYDEFEDEKDRSVKSEKYDEFEDDKDKSVKSVKYDEFEDVEEKSVKSEKIDKFDDDKENSVKSERYDGFEDDEENSEK